MRGHIKLSNQKWLNAGSLWHFGHGRESSQSVHEAILVSWDMGERYLIKLRKKNLEHFLIWDQFLVSCFPVSISLTYD